MIVKNAIDSKNKLWINSIFKGILILFVGYLLYAIFQFYTAKLNTTFQYFCDAEERSGNNFKGLGADFGNAKTQSDKEAYSGKFSCELNEHQKYGMVLEIKNVKPFQTYRARIKHKGDRSNIYLSCNGNKEADLYYESKSASRILENGWAEVELLVTLPKNKNLNSIKFFPYNAKKGKTEFYDDLEVELLEQSEFPFTADNQISLYIDNKGMSKLDRIRKDAMDRGILLTSDDSWVKAKFAFEDSIRTEVKLRLKGDWTEHLETENWSFRIKMPDDIGWNGMMEFSLHSPKARYYLSEWVFHEWLKQEDILATRYDFIKLKVNDITETLYAYEEHFLKQIPENNNRREGVIVKFNEDAQWIRRADAYDYNQTRSDFDNQERVLANIDAFKESKAMKNPALLEQYEKAHELLYQFQHQAKPVHEIFDVERLAKYHAICDLMDANHSRIWHNQRFYYNPITQVLEPIGFDGFTENGAIKYNSKPYMGSFMNKLDGNFWEQYYSIMFSDQKFASLYAHYLYQFSRRGYINSFFESISLELKKREDEIKKYVPNYSFNSEEIIRKSQKIDVELKPIENHSIKAYTQSCNNDSCTIAICNVFRLPITISESGLSKKSRTKISPQFVLTSSPHDIPKYQEFKVKKGTKYLFWGIDGIDKKYSSIIKPFNAPGTENIVYNSSLELQLPIAKNTYHLENNNIHIAPGTYSISSPIIIPKNYQLLIYDGTKINLENQSYILSYGAVQLMGSSESPIIIESSDKNQGFTVTQAPHKSKVSHTIFKGLDRLQENEWQLTGAVTFYESTVMLDNVTISENKCEDALNIIRSDFNIDKIHINNTYADGFDADFCNGLISNSLVTNTGNDGLDFSGSRIEIRDCKMSDIGDKGISGGEASILEIINVRISGADIGIASKDKSKLTGNNIEISNCKKSISAYQKKPEYGGGYVNLSEVKTSNVENYILKDDVSQVIVNGKEQ